MKLIIDISEEDYKSLKDLQSMMICCGGNCKTVQVDVINAIRNGIPYNPTGDLINREALIKSINDFYDNHFNGLVPNELITYAEAVDNFINNAPAIEARPKGKWVKIREERCSVDMSGEIATRYRCFRCGRSITILPSKLVDYPFCNCGADMRNNKEAEND